MTIYIDISQLERARSNTGIQRVLKEFLQRMILEKELFEVKVISYNSSSHQIELLENEEITAFLSDIRHYQFQNRVSINITDHKVVGKHIFFDIDSVWSVDLKREKLYPKLKENGFLIFNFIHDLIPIVMPEVVHEITIMHFKPFLEAVYQHSDMVFFNSHSSKIDFLERKEKLKIERHIPSRVVGLGSDFLELKGSIDRSFGGDILEKKYILFVGTIEPRKNQKEMLDAFEVLAEKYPNLHLVFIGKEGWNVTPLIDRIQSHPLKDKQMHWFFDIDDNLLREFYKNAFIVTYLSKYEGYGLPIVESLQFGNVTIASKNSSMLEAGRAFADYLLYNTKNELVDTISLYCDNISLYHQKKNYIKENFKALSWNTVYDSLLTVFQNYEKSENLKEVQKNSHTKTLQFVFISISFESIKETIKRIDRHMNFVKEYIVITQPKLIETFRSIETTKKLTIIDETEILKNYKKDFHLRDHQSKNWLLRVSLLNLESLDEEFIMLDDDNRPLKDIPIEFFIAKDGCYNAYYFYNLLEWNHKGTAYDLGQHSTCEVLTSQNYELLSYSSHAPQILNRKILQEVASKFFEIGLNQPIDEWSIYFNYAISTYPSLFRQNIFQTLNWPENPLDWEYFFKPKEFSFENYYPSHYTQKIFRLDMNYEEKVAIKTKILVPYLHSRKLFAKNASMLSRHNMVHGVLNFTKEEVEFYLFGVPYLIVVEEDGDIRLKCHYKIINPKNKKLDIVIAMMIFGYQRLFIDIKETTTQSYQEGIVEIPVVSQHLSVLEKDILLSLKSNHTIRLSGVHNLNFDVIINKQYAYETKPPYLSKLIVVNAELMDWYLSQISSTKNPISLKIRLKNRLTKERIKNIPVIGWFARWSFNILKMNHFALHIFHQQEKLNKLEKEIERQRQEIAKLMQLNQEQSIKSQISREIGTQAILFKQRIDEFIDKDLSKPTALTPKKLESEINSLMVDNFYLAFENQFRGSREEIEQRYKSYLKYLNPITKTALDIGCGRGEWVSLLQKNDIDAQGIDLNTSMLNDGVNHGIKNLQNINAFDFFKTCPDSSFDLVTAFHIIEHIPYEELFVFLQEIRRISTPNAVILLETPNPANLLVASFEFYKDPTHLNPLPDDVMKFTVEYFGFEEVRVEKLHSFPDSMRVKEHSQVAQQLNHYLYQERDYLIIARNPKNAIEKSIEQTNPKKKSRLAFLSPMPPQKSGIASYSADLISELSKFYEIEVIEDTTWFKTHHNEYDRVLYHFGNSAFHVEMPELLEITSGVVVLHDFYLSNLMHHAKKMNPTLQYQEHGYQTLLKTQNFPCNGTILNHATGIIVHSEYPKKMLNEWFYNSDTANWSTIPLLRTPPKTEEVLLTKQMLGLPKDAFVVCSFGLLRPNKCNHELLDAWHNSTLAKKTNCYLVFVGNNQAQTEYGAKLEHATKNSNIHITNWVNDITFKSYLSIANLAVQLRTNSTGETSATVLDCMNYQIPLIVNANGSNQELPSDTVVMLEESFETEELKEAMEELYSDKTKRDQLSIKAQAHIERYHTPKVCARLYYEAIEQHYTEQNNHKKNEIKKITTLMDNNQEQIKCLLLSDFSPIRQQQILIDVSTIIRHDLKTGIERVVRSQITALIQIAPAHIRIEPVYLEGKTHPPQYRYARAYTQRLLGKNSPIKLEDEPIKLNRGDIFYGLDLCAKEVNIATKANLYNRYRALGVRINFMVYDLLPITYPHFFPAKMEAIHQKWFSNITSVADQLICISQKVAGEVTSHFDVCEAKASNSPSVTTLHLGADLETEAIVPNRTKLTPSSPITFLMVGTVEPRKGHQEVLEAFEKLWEEGHEIHLKIVGKQGWNMEEFISKLAQHPQQNHKLFYLDFVSDEELNTLYTSSDALIVASYDEGFGLPLIEGARQKIPLIARDIEVFREIAGAFAFYFETHQLDSAIKAWIERYQKNQHPSSTQMPYLTWQENAQKLLKML